MDGLNSPFLERIVYLPYRRARPHNRHIYNGITQPINAGWIAIRVV